MAKVLTVDDSKVVRTMVARALQPYGCQVIEAQNGQEGVEAAKAQKPDLILLDVTMPVMDGRQALAAMRADETCKAIPVIMLTAETGKDIVVEVAKLGVTGYIIKPFKQETFDKEVQKVLGQPSAGGPVDSRAVLIVDDSEKVLEAARAALEKTMTVLTALSGAEAIKQYQEARPGVVVVDLSMPEMDGFQTILELQKLGRSGYVALSVRGDEGAHDRARKAGYHSVVDKPFQQGDLVEHVLTAASTIVSAEDLLQCCLSELSGCPIFSLPKAKMLGRLLPEFSKKLRRFAEDGNDKLILDIAQLNEVTSDHVNSLVRMLSEAETVGIRTAICTPDSKVIDSLKQFAEARDARYAATLEAAVQAF
jgi:two-component system, cell cycle response regulator